MSNHGRDQKRQRFSLDSSNLPDYQSEAPLYRSSGSDSAKSVDDQLLSVNSIGASNDQSCYSFERNINEDSESTSSPTTSDHNDEEEEIQMSKPFFSAKRRRMNPEIHNLSERKRRDKINMKMRALQALIPNSDNVDKASMLDNAIEYLKRLQSQFQLQLQLHLQIMMRMGSRMCMAPTPMMLPTMQQIQAANMMGMRMPIGVGLCPNPPLLGRMLLPMPPLSHTPAFIPLIGGGSSALALPSNCGSISDLMSINNHHTLN